jgi:hypothetical protein
VPGGWGFQISWQSTHEGVKVVIPKRLATFTHLEILLVLISVRGRVEPWAVVRPEGLCRWKIPVSGKWLTHISKALQSFGTFRPIYITTQVDVAEDVNLHQYHSENLQSHNHISVTSFVCTEGTVTENGMWLHATLYNCVHGLFIKLHIFFISILECSECCFIVLWTSWAHSRWQKVTSYQLFVFLCPFFNILFHRTYFCAI